MIGTNIYIYILHTNKTSDYATFCCSSSFVMHTEIKILYNYNAFFQIHSTWYLFQNDLPCCDVYNFKLWTVFYWTLCKVSSFIKNKKIMYFYIINRNQFLAYLSVCSSVCKFLHFELLFNHFANFNQRHKASLQKGKYELQK